MNLFQFFRNLFRKPKPQAADPIIPTVYVAPPVTVAPPAPTVAQPKPVEGVLAQAIHRQILRSQQPFGVNNYGMPFQSQAEADAWKAAVALRDAEQAKVGGLNSDSKTMGPIPVYEVTDAEMDFLLYASRNFAGCTHVIQGVLSGTVDAIALKVGQADGRVKAGDVPQGTDRVRGYVDAFSKGLLPVVWG